MSFASKLKVESIGMLLAVSFYTIVGIAFLAVLPMTGFPLHLGIIGISSLITAYGLFMKRSWTIFLVFTLLFVATTFSLYMLYYYLPNDYLLALSMVAYLILTWVVTAYASARRKTLEN